MTHQGVEIPPRRMPEDDRGYLEELTKAVFRAGFSWQVIHDKWPAFLDAFDGFDIQRVAAYGEPHIDRLLSDARIVRNGRKIEATVFNAQVMSELIDEHGSLHDYLRSLDGLSYAERRKVLSQRFRNVGPTTVFVFLYSVNEEVPSWDERNA